MVRRVNNRAKIIGLAILLIPIAFLSLFLIGETVGGDWSGLIHLVQMLPLLLLALLAWKKPLIGGILLVSIGVLLGIAYALSARGFPIQTILLVELILFSPPIVSGICFLSASKKQSQ
ncbi:hypothetical protein A2Z00_01495 [Candidatus Gottesmanbacteria bacterium RBG_13_45_10]|uniref:DUF7670 domain-containing protein n=1 Tax=Candidatus Gottesmanbacteria bacterium RBG_13_45_10 TaxID=1798370 RepID=A0A1F5ZH42_9BACT|nr:MAG: hypothetical protein A2Z00_01495 [Candidatus Gottesmanbacteria bacterium RBG_13_45_10]